MSYLGYLLQEFNVEIEMKTLDLKNITKLLAGALIAISVACDKKGSDPAPPPVAPVASYQYVNGVCTEVTTNTPAAVNLCAGVATTQYHSNGYQCLDAGNLPVDPALCANGGVGGAYTFNGTQCVGANGIPVAYQLCQNNATNGFQLINGQCYTTQGSPVSYNYCSSATGYVANQCNGQYVMYQAGIMHTINCQGTSCSGRTVLEYWSGRQIVCP